ncbi:MAG: potassium channel protein [Rhodothermales bacterium]|nr:potassium channel protein [Rhodothermales bacterium]MBO6781569.1 potassium channel protein [Rhodothermales bacterium]
MALTRLRDTEHKPRGLSRADDSARRELMAANLALAGLMGLGAVGYVVIEEWSWLDAFYMTFITLTTIGFGEVQSLSPLGRVFTIFLGLGGIGTVAFIATRSAQILINSRTFSERHRLKMIEKLSDHYIICGFGRIGSRIAVDLSVNDIPFLIIERSQPKIDQILDAGFTHVDGDAEEEMTLDAAGIRRAKGLILTLPEDRANVFVTLVAREMNPDVFILARTDKEQNRRKLLRAGANQVISPYEIGADRMAQVILRPDVDKFMSSVRFTESMNLQEVKIEEGSLLAGSSLDGSDFRSRFEAIVVAIIDKETDKMVFNPRSDVELTPGDSLVVLGSLEMVQQLREEGCAPATA